MQFLNGTDYLAQSLTDEVWVLPDILPVGGMMCIYGKAKAGKSYFMLGLLEAISSGKTHYLGIPIAVNGPCLYLQVDTPPGTWRSRIRKVQKLGLYDFSQIHFGDKKICPYPFSILEHGRALKAIIDQIKPVVIAIDTIREIHDGDENDSSAMKSVITGLDWATGDSAVILATHKKKEGPMHADDLMDDVRGSSYVVGRMDAIGFMTKEYFRFQSREHELTDIAMAQDDDLEGMHKLAGDGQLLLDVMREITSIMAGMSQRQQAELLAERFNLRTGEKGKKLTIAAARKQLQRKQWMFAPSIH